MPDSQGFDFDTRWEAWIAPGHAPARSSDEGRRTRQGMLVELIVTAAL